MYENYIIYKLSTFKRFDVCIIWKLIHEYWTIRYCITNKMDAWGVINFLLPPRKVYYTLLHTNFNLKSFERDINLLNFLTFRIKNVDFIPGAIVPLSLESWNIPFITNLFTPPPSPNPYLGSYSPPPSAYHPDILIKFGSSAVHGKILLVMIISKNLRT